MDFYSRFKYDRAARLKTATLRNIIDRRCTAKRVPLIDEQPNKFL
jgi:hypothetical protein